MGFTGGLAFHVAGLAGIAKGPLLGLSGRRRLCRGSRRNRVVSAGSGLLWGLASALLLWFASLFPLSLGKMPMMDAARAHFPTLVGALLLFGAPLGLALGAYRARTRVQTTDGAGRFSLARALTCGGLAGAMGGTVFAWWIARSGQLPVVAGLVGSRSPLVGLTLHFGLALAIGGSFGLFFQPGRARIWFQHGLGDGIRNVLVVPRPFDAPGIRAKEAA